MNSNTTLGRRAVPRIPVRGRELTIVYSVDETAVGRSFPLDGTTYLLGREGDPGQSVGDARMSRRHARFALRDAGYAVEDLGSHNGIFVDGLPTEGEAPIQPNGVISIGDTLLVVDQEPDPDGLPCAPGSTDEVEVMIGVSLASKRLRRSLSTVAPSAKSVLLLGPTGSGKEVSAKAIHDLSGRRGRFVAVNCAAVPAELAESQFFGHAMGSFTGAVSDHVGYFEQADGGTLFLDELGDLPPSLQAKLLRVIEDRIITPTGASVSRKVDARLIAATNVSLEASGFRSDLYARLADLVLILPSLAERRADILVLWKHFLAEAGRKDQPFAPELAEAVLLYSWPRNVRELRKRVENIVTITDSDELLDLHHLPAPWRAPLLSRSSDEEALPEDPEEGAPSRAVLEAALRESRGNMSLAAAKHGWHRTQLYRWLRRAGISPTKFR